MKTYLQSVQHHELTIITTNIVIHLRAKLFSKKMHP